MAIPDKIIEEVVETVAGKDVILLVKKLKDKENVSEFKLAESIKQEINTTRNMLYRLYDNNLVTFIRKKDKQKGWYIYYWTFNPTHIKHLLITIKKRQIMRLNERLTRETGGQFFACENKCMRLDFEQATDFQYKCPECGVLLNQEDNTKIVEDIKQKVEILEKELVAIKKLTITIPKREVEEPKDTKVKKTKTAKKATKKKTPTKKKTTKKATKKAVKKTKTAKKATKKKTPTKKKTTKKAAKKKR